MKEILAGWNEPIVVGVMVAVVFAFWERIKSIGRTLERMEALLKNIRDKD